ncbi:penicillin acylase family protein [Pleionea litopenaei]|uniref:Penicillin acylase family protein n=1 Tax=Pleionea litopenaei TaxID=3070815 RepID=A0AA51RV35_9GAMM|nr:penicillin acylase family protein [Pleionea sp. HL-JVS1]WMS88034.1 penicillin acylase family protein [Pleionea sp. HL-JVS1]
MDLLRRSAAGELSAIFGDVALSMDKQRRLHRFRARAQQIVNRLPAEHLNLLEVYTAGVNQGLEQLSTSPFEYWLLNTEPKPWTIEDSILVVFAMYLDLQAGSPERERVLKQAYSSLPKPLYELLVPKRTEFDAPLIAPNTLSPNSVEPESIDPKTVDPETVEQETNRPNLTAQDLYKTQTVNRLLNDKVFTSSHLQHISETSSIWSPFSAQEAKSHPDLTPGSNNFAIAGSRSENHSAIVAGDMHLGLSVPNIWYKANLMIQNSNSSMNLYGVTLPGTPLMIAGSNDYVAWTFTNSYGDYADVIELTLNDDKPHQYRVDTQTHNFTYVKETIEVKNGTAVELTLRESIFGPTYQDEQGKVYSLLWVAHQPEAVNLNLLAMESAENLEQALAVANRSAIPAQNILIGDRNGDIGWTIIGPLPQRREGKTPFDTIAHQNGNITWLDEQDYPRVINHPQGALWTANNRVSDNAALQKIGDGGYALGVRAQTIKSQLLEINNGNEQDLLNIQLSTDTPIYRYWQRKLLANKRLYSNLTSEQQSFFELIEAWNGHSDADQAGFTFVYLFRQGVREILLDQQADQWFAYPTRSFGYYSRQYEQTLRKIIDERNKSLLPPQYSDYDALYRQVIDDIITRLTENNAVLEDQTWGNFNRLKIQHPISRAVPFLGRFLDRPQLNMPGDALSPRVQRPSFGASQRMVVSPGNISSAIFHMPGGQSGHPLSPFYSAGFEDWASGNSTPLKKAETELTLTLTPQP